MCKSFSIAEIVMSCRARHFLDLFRVVYKALRINLSLFFKASPTPSFHFGNNFSRESSRYIFRIIFMHRQIKLILNSYTPDLALINFVSGVFLMVVSKTKIEARSTQISKTKFSDLSFPVLRFRNYHFLMRRKALITNTYIHTLLIFFQHS